jgi:hypothetical protein
MSVAIHYSFTLKQTVTLKQLVNEVADICESMEWKYDIIHAENIDAFTILAENKLRYAEADITGLLFSASNNCEPVWLTFLPNGRSSTITNVTFETYTAANEQLYWASTKTQFAGASIHVAIVKLFKYLSQKYFSVTEVEDEGNYWNSGDAQLLQEKISFFNAAISTLQEAMQQLSIMEGESINAIADKIEALLQQKLNKPSDG